MTGEDTEIAHFGILQSAFWRHNPRPPPPVNALELLDPINAFSSYQDGILVPSQQLEPQHTQLQNVVQKSQSSSRYDCPNIGCSKSFIRKEHLNRHLVIHANVRPFKCNICKRSFTRNDILRRHALQHSVTLPLPRTPTACVQCHRRKLRCDNNTPCQTCIYASSKCLRTSPNEHKAVEYTMTNKSASQSTSNFPATSSSLDLKSNGNFMA